MSIVIRAATLILAMRRIGGDASRQQPGQIARAISDHGHGFLGQRREHQFAFLAVGQALARAWIDDLRQKVILPDCRSVIGGSYFLGNAGANHNRLALNIDRVDTEERFRFPRAGLRPMKLGAEYAHLQIG